MNVWHGVEKIGGVLEIIAVSAIIYSPFIIYTVATANGSPRDAAMEAQLITYWREIREFLNRYGTSIPEPLRRKLSARLRVLIYERDNYICQYCGRHTQSPHCDHILPFSRGGADHPSNLVTACPECNWSKSDKTPKEWFGWLARGNRFIGVTYVA